MRSGQLAVAGRRCTAICSRVVCWPNISRLQARVSCGSKHGVYITSQWLRGFPERPRGHYPVKVSIKSLKSTGKWERGHKIVCKIEASKPSGDYQRIYMTQGELHSTLRKFITGSSLQMRINMAKSILKELDDPELFALLGDLFGQR